MLTDLEKKQILEAVIKDIEVQTYRNSIHNIVVSEGNVEKALVKLEAMKKEFEPVV